MYYVTGRLSRRDAYHITTSSPLTISPRRAGRSLLLLPCVVAEDGEKGEEEDEEKVTNSCGRSRLQLTRTERRELTCDVTSQSLRVRPRTSPDTVTWTFVLRYKLPQECSRSAAPSRLSTVVGIKDEKGA